MVALQVFVGSNDHHAMSKKQTKTNKQTNKPKDEANVFTLQFLLSHHDVP
jgi:hypothetical protein